MEVLRKYGESCTLLFPLIDAGAADFEATPVTFASGDTQVSKDEGAFANTTNNPAHEGNGIYSLVLTATEMQAARVVVTLIDSATKAWEDQAVVISTYGNASAQHAFDLDTATQAVDVTSISGDATAADNLEADYDGTGYNKSASTVGTVTTLSGHTAQTGDSFARLGAPAGASVSADIAAIQTDTNNIETDTQDIQSRLPAALVGGKMDSDMTAISGDTVAADNAESYFDGTGYGPLLQRTTIATLTSQTQFTLTAGSADNDAYNGCLIVVQDASTAAQKAVGVISDYTGATKEVFLLNDPSVFTIATTDIVTILADRSLKPAVDNRTLGVAADGDLIEVNTLTGHTAQTGDNFARLGAPAGASVSADIAAIEAQTDDIGVAGAGLTAVPWNASWDAEVQSEVDDALVAFFTSAAQLVDDIWDEAVAGHVGAGSFGEEVQSHATPAEVNTQVVDTLATDTYAELGAVPAATSTLADKINFLFALARNKQTVTATTHTLRNDADSGNIATSAVSDDGTTFTHAEWT